jgi:hypothetical protein
VVCDQGKRSANTVGMTTHLLHAFVTREMAAG